MNCSITPHKSKENPMGKFEDMINTIEKDGKQAQGKAFLLRHLRQGGKLTRKQAMLAACYMCVGYCIDGLKDCDIPYCPMYPFRPWKNK